MSHHHFDSLADWSTKSDAELSRLFNRKAALELERIVQDLDENASRVNITKQTFTPLVRRMRVLYEEGSKSLSHAILEAGDLRDAGRPDEARQVLSLFASRCPSPFYRVIAQSYANRASD